MHRWLCGYWVEVCEAQPYIPGICGILTITVILEMLIFMTMFLKFPVAPNPVVVVKFIVHSGLSKIIIKVHFKVLNSFMSLCYLPCPTLSGCLSLLGVYLEAFVDRCLWAVYSQELFSVQPVIRVVRFPLPSEQPLIDTSWKMTLFPDAFRLADGQGCHPPAWLALYSGRHCDLRWVLFFLDIIYFDNISPIYVLSLFCHITALIPLQFPKIFFFKVDLWSCVLWPQCSPYPTVQVAPR